MRSLLAFIKKECMEQFRTGRLLLLGILFLMLGIMNPAVAKLTPWLVGMLADSLSGSGIIFTAVTVTAMDSWVQFFKNIPIGLFAFVLLESGIFTKEYRTGTLLLSVTKGLERCKVVVSKALVLAVLWTFCYALCAGVTCAYTAYYWDNAVVQNLMFSVVCWWLFGIWTVALAVFFSAVSGSNTGVLAGTGGIILTAFLLGIFPRIGKILPVVLADGNSLICGAAEAEAYTAPFIMAVCMSAVCFALSIPLLNRKRL